MVLRQLSFLMFAVCAASPVHAVQTTPATPKCQLPPPLECPPDPPNGPKTRSDLDQYLKGLDSTLLVNRDILSKSQMPSPTAVEDQQAIQIRRSAPQLESYFDALQSHRNMVAEYREKLPAEQPK